MKKLLCFVIALLLMAPLVTACGDRDGSKDSNVITFVYGSSQKGQLGVLLEEFQSLHPEYVVKPEWVGMTDIQSKQDVAMGARKPYDVNIGGDAYLQKHKRVLHPLNDFIERDGGEMDYEDFLPKVRDALTTDGKTFYLPHFMNIGLLYYNKDIFDAAGETYPNETWTLDTFFEKGKQFTKRSGNAVTQWGSDGIIGWWGEWLAMVRLAGGDVIKDGLFDLNTPEAIAGMTKYYERMNGPVGSSGETVWNTKIGPNGHKGDDSLGNFNGGKTAMNFESGVQNWLTLRALPEHARFNWDATALPTGAGASGLSKGRAQGAEFAIEGYGIHKDSKNKEGAWQLIKFLTQKRTGAKLSAFDYLPCRTSEKNEILATPKAQRKPPQNMEAVYGAIENAMSLPAESYFLAVTNDYCNPIIQKMLEKDYTPAAACAKITADCNAIIKASYM